VWAPPTLTHREKLTAMVLADDANDQTRVTWSSVVDPEIMRQAMIKNDRDMRKVVARLQDEKVIEHAGGGHNGRTAKYRFLHMAPASVAKPVQKEPATDDVGGPKETGYADEREVKPVRNDPPTGTVAGPNRHRSRSKSDPPTPSLPTTSPSKTAARKRAAAGEKHTVADQLTAAFWERHGKGRAQSFVAVRSVIRTCIGNGIERDDLARALDQLAREGRPISGGTVQIALQPSQAPPGRRPFTNPADHNAYDGDLQ
jgi:hypothetical protein